MTMLATRTDAPTMAALKANTAARDKIRYAIGKTALGAVLVACGAVGVCAILMGSDADDLTIDLAKRFPSCRLVPDKLKLNEDLSKIIRFINAPKRELDVKVEMHGTPFQCRVWTALRGVPIGSTVTYSELARRIGDPNAVRAVANACASNNLALAVPCHRVVRSDGGLANYRWGVERKRALIAKEAAV